MCVYAWYACNVPFSSFQDEIQLQHLPVISCGNSSSRSGFTAPHSARHPKSGPMRVDLFGHVTFLDQMQKVCSRLQNCMLHFHGPFHFILSAFICPTVLIFILAVCGIYITVLKRWCFSLWILVVTFVFFSCPLQSALCVGLFQFCNIFC